MAEVVVCRICWNVNVKMYKLRDCILENYFIQMLGRFCEPRMPQSLEHVCYECAYLLRKYYLFKEKCLRAQHIFADLFEKSGKITYQDVLSVDREKFKLSSNLVHISSNNNFHYYEYCDIKTEFNTSLETIEGNSLTKIDTVKLEEEIKDDSSNPDFENDEQIFSAPLEEKPTTIKTGYEKKQLCKKPKLNRGCSETSNSHSIRLLNKSANKQVLKKFKARRKQSNLNDQKRRRGPKPNPNGLTPEEMKIQDKFSVRMLTLEEQCEELSKRQQSSNYVNSKFKCDLCYKGFIDSSTYNRHMARHDPANGSVKCSICKMVFQYERHLRNHSRHHNRSYICRTCSFVCKSMTQAKQHQNRHEGKFYKCKMCEYVSLKWSSYLSHTRIKHPSEFVCDMCHCSFVSKLGLSKHKTMMHKNGAVLEKRETRGKQQQIKKKPVRSKTSTYCETCNLTCSARNWSKHIASIGHKIKSNEDFTCGVCKETLPSGEALRLHNRRLHPKRRGRSRGNPLLPKTWPAKCPHCNEELPDAPKYYWHFRKVHPDKPYPLIKNYICDVCGKRFKTNAYLVYHRRTHFNDRPYKCKQCPKAFFEKQNLVVHEKWHSDQRPFPCSVCCKAFKTRGALQRHFMLHTGEKPYVCEFCGKAFNQSNSRKGHVKAVHLKEPTSYSRSRPRRAAPARTPARRDEPSLQLP